MGIKQITKNEKLYDVRDIPCVVMLKSSNNVRHSVKFVISRFQK